MFKLLIATLITLLAFASSTIVFPAVNRQGPDVGAILFQGAQINASNYAQFVLELQQKFANLWVAVADGFPSNEPESNMCGYIINQALKDLSSAGLVISNETPFVFIGHSLGGKVIQDYVFNEPLIPVKPIGLILEGSFIERQNYNSFNRIRDLNILTIGGELDGIIRITRMAESIYFDKKDSHRLTLIVEGMNHYQFAGEGQPPKSIEENDFQPEIDNANARSQLTLLIAAFLRVTLKNESQSDQALLQMYLNSTQVLMQPLLDAFIVEGSYNYNPPCCLTRKGVQKEDCTYGSLWSGHSQQVMGSNVTIIATDRFYPAAKVFPEDPLPSIHNKCSGDEKCVLNVTTVSELIYSTDQSKDLAFYPQGAVEIRTKLMSRQSILLAATGVKHDFADTDGGNLCSEINNESLKWAIDKTRAKTLNRYLNKGKQLRIVNDRDLSSFGPLWIWSSIVKQLISFVTVKLL